MHFASYDTQYASRERTTWGFLYPVYASELPKVQDEAGDVAFPGTTSFE